MITRKVLMPLFACLITVCVMGQRSFELPLWEKGQISDTDYAEPHVYCYLPAEPNGKAVVACPGGAYTGLAMEHEGKGFASLLNGQGYALIVLKYRLPAGRCNVPSEDAKQAMRIVRSHAAEWGIRKVGIMGSSAGGHLASTLATHYVDSITRPDFQVLLYPVITMDLKHTHLGSREALLGKTPSSELVALYSNELHVPDNAPPAFIVVPSGDTCVPVYNSLQYAQSLVDKGVPVTLHMYEDGYHGFGCNRGYADYDQWIGEMMYWLGKQ